MWLICMHWCTHANVMRPWECRIVDAPTSETQQFPHLRAPSTCGYVTIPLKMKRIFSASAFCISYTVCMIIWMCTYICIYIYLCDIIYIWYYTLIYYVIYIVYIYMIYCVRLWENPATKKTIGKDIQDALSMIFANIFPSAFWAAHGAQKTSSHLRGSCQQILIWMELPSGKL